MANSASIGTQNVVVIQKTSLWNFIKYFLHLGAFGFGGPIVLSSHMRRDLVDDRQWVSSEDFEQGLALAQLAPGPLAAQLAIYLGWIKGRVVGATLIGIAFILPSFLLVLALSWLYVHFSGLKSLQSLFYGIGASVIAIMFQGAYKLFRKTVGRDVLFLLIASLSAIITVVTESEIIWVFLASGLLAVFIKTPPKFMSGKSLSIAFPSLLWSGMQGEGSTTVLWTILGFFAKAGLFVFGSGLAIVPFLHSGVVSEQHWLTESQFVDAIAVAMITPGPVVITVAFIGYLVAGFLGAVAAAAGVFLPCYLMVLVIAPYYRRIAHVPQIKSFIGGVTSAAVGAIAGAAVVLGKRSIIDIPTVVIFSVSMVLLIKAKKVPEPIIIVVSGLVGLLLKAWI